MKSVIAAVLLGGIVASMLSSCVFVVKPDRSYKQVRKDGRIINVMPSVVCTDEMGRFTECPEDLKN